MNNYFLNRHPMMTSEPLYPLLSIARLRMGIDGNGITTLAYRNDSQERITYTPGETVKIRIETCLHSGGELMTSREVEAAIRGLL